MRTPILSVVLTALVCTALLGSVGYVQAQSGYEMSLNGDLRQRYVIGDDYSEAGVIIDPPLADYDKLIEVDIFVAGSMAAAHSIYLAYLEDWFNRPPYTLKFQKNEYLLKYRYGNEAVGERTLCYANSLAPEMGLIGPEEVELECRSTYNDLKGWAIDECDGEFRPHEVLQGGSVDLDTPGTYTRFYRATNTYGYESVLQREFTVVDTQAPIITLDGKELFNIALHENFADVDPGATAYDECEGDLTSEIIVDYSDIDPTVEGDYVVTYMATDEAGNEGVATRRIRVGCDSEGPVIELMGDDIMEAECGTGLADDPGVTAWDDCEEDISEDVVWTDSPDDFGSLGQVIRTYTVTNFLGQSASISRTLNVVDTTPPTITLLGANPMSLELGEAYIEEGATAEDACEGAVAVTIVGDEDVDVDVQGRYWVTYLAVDSSGNEAEIKRLVRVACGDVELELEGRVTVNLECGEEFVEPGFTASDECEDDLSDEVTFRYPLGEVDPMAVDTTYRIIYDLYGKQKNRVINVIDTTEPEILLEGKDTMSVYIGTEYVEPGYTAWDLCSGELTDQVTVTGTVDENTEGNYTLIYRVADAAGLVGTATRVVEVGYDPEKPVVKLNGDAIVTVECGGTFDDPGAFATNELETKEYDVTATKLPSEALRTPGEYVIIYSATNELGNTMDISRKIIVVDTVDPVIVLRGDEEMIVDQGSVYVDPGVRSALDDCDGDLRSAVLFTSNVNTAVLGVYHVEFVVRDSSGNKAVAVRTVQVRAVAEEVEGEGTILEGEDVVPEEGEVPVEEGEIEGEDEAPACGCNPDGSVNWLGGLFLAGLSIAFIIFMICFHENL